MSATIPALLLVGAEQSHVGLVDQGRRLQSLPRFLVCQPRGSQFAQLIIDQRQEFLRGMRIAVLDGREDAGEVVHNGPAYSLR